MALVKGATFRLVGIVDVEQVIEELASSTLDDITEFVIEVIGQTDSKKNADHVARAILDMVWLEVEVEEDEADTDLLAHNLDGEE